MIQLSVHVCQYALLANLASMERGMDTLHCTLLTIIMCNIHVRVVYVWERDEKINNIYGWRKKGKRANDNKK